MSWTEYFCEVLFKVALMEYCIYYHYVKLNEIFKSQNIEFIISFSMAVKRVLRYTTSAVFVNLINRI